MAVVKDLLRLLPSSASASGLAGSLAMALWRQERDAYVPRGNPVVVFVWSCEGRYSLSPPLMLVEVAGDKKN